MADLIQSIQGSIYINLIYEHRYLFLIKGFGMTLYLTFLSFLLGTVIGAIFCRLRVSKISAVSKAIIWLKTLFIRLPTLVLLIIFTYMLFSDSSLDTVTLAIMAFALKTGSYISDIMYSAIETVDKGEIEAARTLGMSRFYGLSTGCASQAIKMRCPYTRIN